MGIHRHFSASCDDCGTVFKETHEVWVFELGAASTELGVAKFSEDLKIVLRDCYWKVGGGIVVCPNCQIVRSLEKVQKEIIAIHQQTPTNTKEKQQP